MIFVDEEHEEARNIVTKTGNYGMAGFSQSTTDADRVEQLPSQNIDENR